MTWFPGTVSRHSPPQKLPWAHSAEASSLVENPQTRIFKSPVRIHSFSRLRRAWASLTYFG